MKDIARVFDAGMSMARINLSHGSLKTNLKLIGKFKDARRLRPHKQCALMLELRGREIRIGKAIDGEVEVKSNSLITLDCQSPGIGGVSDTKTFYANCDIIQRYLKPNDVVYIDDGKVIGVVLEVTNEGCLFEVKVGGPVRSYSQLRFVGGKHQNLPIVHPKDIEDLTQISKQIPIDFLSIPFTAKGEDISKVREMLGETGK